jgi:hypothetical protein
MIIDDIYPKQKLAESMLMEDPIYRNFKRVGRYIAERRMSEKEILQVFADAEAGMTDKATGANRTMLGRGKDVTTDFAGNVKSAVTGILNSIQNSVPVSAVDVAYDQATDALAKVAGGQKGPVMQAIKKYRNLVKQYPKTAGFAKAALVAIAGLATGGAGLPAIAGLTYALDSAIKGDKLSSVLGKGVGAAALSAAGQAAYGAMAPDVGQGLPDRPSAASDFGAGTYDAGAGAADAASSRFDDIVSNAVDYKVKPDDTLTKILADRKINPEAFRRLPGNEVFFSPDGNPNILKAGQTIKLPDPADIPDLNRMSYTTPSNPRFDAEYDTTGYTGQYNQNSTSSLDAANNLKQQGFGRLGSDNGMAAARVAQDTGGAAAGPEQLSGPGVTKPASTAISPQDIKPFGSGAPDTSLLSNPGAGSATGIEVAGMPVVAGQPLNPTQMAVANMSMRSGNVLNPVVQAAYDLAKRGAVRESTKLTKLPAEFSNPVWESWLPAVTLRMVPINKLFNQRSLTEGKARGKSLHLTTFGAYTVFENVNRYRKAIMELKGVPGSTRPEYYRPDMSGAPTKPDKKPGLIGRGLNALDRGVKKVGGALSNFGHQFTTNVTKEKLKMNWHQAGKPSDSAQLAAWLVKQGVPQEVVNSVYSKMGIPVSPVGTPAPAPSAQTQPVANKRSAYTNNPYGVDSAPAPAATTAPAATAEPSLDLLKRATSSLQGGPALSAAELQQVNSYRKSQGEPAMPAATAAQPAGFNAANVMKMPGMEKYAKPAAPAKTPNFAGPSGYGKVTTSFKTGAPAAPKAPAAPAAPKQPITIGGQKIQPTDPAYDKIMRKATIESLTWSKNFDPGMTLLKKMRK